MTFSGLLETWLLSFNPSWIILEHLQVLKWSSGARVVVLEGSCKGWNAGFGLACVATAAHPDLNIQKTSIARHCQWLQDSVPVLRLVEILNEWFPIDHYSTCAGFHVHDSLRCLALSETPSSSLLIQFWLTLFLRKSSPEIEKIDTIVFGEVISTVFQSLETIESIGIDLIRKFA